VAGNESGKAPQLTNWGEEKLMNGVGSRKRLGGIQERKKKGGKPHKGREEKSDNPRG